MKHCWLQSEAVDSAELFADHFESVYSPHNGDFNEVPSTDEIHLDQFTSIDISS